MKLNNIFKISKLTVAATLLLSIGTSCISDSINRDPLLPTKEDEKKDGVIYGAYLPNLEKSVIPVGTPAESTEPVNRYQIGVNLAGDTWIGYMSPRANKWNSGKNFTSYFMLEGWVGYMYSFMVTDVISPWLQIKRSSQDEGTKNDEIYALAQIIKVAALHRTTDTFGPLPYSQLGKGSFKVAYDSQESIYRSFFKELEWSIDVLTKYSQNSSTILPSFDIVYDGNVDKWIRFANSLMLRLAIRVRYADPALAKEYAEKAVKNPKGLIDAVANAAKMGKGAGLQMQNPLKVINEEYNDTRMGGTIYCYLNGYNDPRKEVYFVNTNKPYQAIRGGIPDSGNTYNDCNRPRVKVDDPVFWMKASEVLFLKAEGALAGFDMGGTASAFYNDGIRMSMAENGITTGVENYIISTNQPSSFVDPYNSNYSTGAPSGITVKWDDAATNEEKLERIITQKYLALFPNGQEAWTEWRRTGYPRLLVAYINKTNSGVLIGNGFDKGGVRRIPYPINEYNQNGENLKQAITQLLGGEDLAATKLWWDKKNK